MFPLPVTQTSHIDVGHGVAGALASGQAARRRQAQKVAETQTTEPAEDPSALPDAPVEATDAAGEISADLRDERPPLPRLDVRA